LRAEALEAFPRELRFADLGSLFRDAALDAVVIATPHPEHETPTLAALSAGMHVLTEKPLAASLPEAERMLEEYGHRTRRAQLFATALVLRADPRYVKLRAMLRDGTLGRVQRIAWTVTDCFRSAAYFESAEWRGTFRGEGGGLLVNQCSHQLDLWQWLFGMPDRVRAFVELGRFHAIEVEDQVTAYLEYAKGATGVFVASTGETPGTNRLEVAAELGRVVVEGSSFELWRNAAPAPELVRTSGVRTPVPAAAYEKRELIAGGVGPAGLLRNFVRAIAGEEPLLSPASEGLRSIELANALLASGFGSHTVELSGEHARHPRHSEAVRPS
jgi:predicted dehydrogenase